MDGRVGGTRRLGIGLYEASKESEREERRRDKRDRRTNKKGRRRVAVGVRLQSREQRVQAS